MNISACTILDGQVTEVVLDPVSSLVGLSIGGGATVHASITKDSVLELGLAAGSRVVLLLEATRITLAEGFDGAKAIAPNLLAGRVASIVDGLAGTEVELAVGPGAVIRALIPEDRARAMDLRIGDAITAMFQASDVILATEELFLALGVPKT